MSSAMTARKRGPIMAIRLNTNDLTVLVAMRKRMPDRAVEARFCEQFIQAKKDHEQHRHDRKGEKQCVQIGLRGCHGNSDAGGIVGAVTRRSTVPSEEIL